MIDMTFSDGCRLLMAEFGFSEELAKTTINRRDKGLVDNNGNRIVAFHWTDDDSLMFVDSVVTRKELVGRMYRFDAVEATVVLMLRSTLPAGQITRHMEMDAVLILIAASFGLRFRCPPDQRSSTLYRGPVRITNGLPDLEFDDPPTQGFAIAGNFSQHSSGTTNAFLLWAFDPTKYREWRSRLN